MQELHFAEAPHELPLVEGQSVPMRAWWRHGGLIDCELQSVSRCTVLNTTHSTKIVMLSAARV